MRLRLHSILFCCLLLVFPSLSLAQSQEVITESDVMALLNSVDRAARKKNIAAMVAPLASDVKIKMAISAQGSDKEQVVQLTKEQYTFNLRHNLRRTLSYTVDRKNTRVKMYDDNKTAMVTSNIYETLKIAQGTLRAVSSETAILTLRNGKLVITSVEARTRFY